MTTRSLLSIVVTLFIMIYPTNHAFKEKCSRQSFFLSPQYLFLLFFSPEISLHVHCPSVEEL